MDVVLIAKTKLLADNAKTALSNIGVHEYNPDQGTDGESVVAYAGRRCYNSFEVGQNPNVTKVRTEIVEYIDNILHQGHGSVLEHVYFTFSIEGVSRVLTAELNRHRAGAAISEASGRYIRIKDHIPFVWPSIFAFDGIGSLDQRMRSCEVITNCLDQILIAYKQLEDIWQDEFNSGAFSTKKKLTSAMRRILPMGLATGGVWTFNLRALRHIIATRGSVHAEEEIIQLATELLRIMATEEPSFFNDFNLTQDGLTPKYPKV